MRTFPPLPAQRLSGPVLIARPAPPKGVTEDSPAIDVMTDLRHVHAAIIAAQTTVEAAHAYMVQREVRLLLVLSADRSLAGLITATDILGEKPLYFAQERRVRHSDILVADIMTPVERLEAIALSSVKHARVGEVIASLRETGRQHTLVVERDAQGRPLVCGIFSRSQIERQLGAAIPPQDVANTFAELETALVAS